MSYTITGPSGSAVPHEGQTLSWSDAGITNMTQTHRLLNYGSFFLGLPQTDSGSVDLTLQPGTTYSLQGEIWYYNSNPYHSSYKYSNTITFTTRTVPGSFSLSSPANGASGVSRRPALSWSSSANATGYKVFIGPSPGEMAEVANVIGTQYTLTEAQQLDWDGTYYWRVQAYDQYSQTQWSNGPHSFTVMAEPQPPAKAVNVGPEDEATEVPRTVTLEFKDGGGEYQADSYDIYFGTDPQAVDQADTESAQFKANVSHSGGQDATQSYNPGSLGHYTDYYWRIDAVNDTGATKGDVWHFKTVQAQLGSPADKVYKKKLTALCDDQFWYEDADGNMAALAELTGLDLTKPADMVAAYQKVFIVNGGLKKVVDFSNTKLTVDSLAHIPMRGNILNQDATGSAIVIDFIDGSDIYGFVTHGGFETGEATFTEDGDGYTLNITAVEAVSGTPKVYDWKVYPHNDDEGDVKVHGKMPDEPTILALYRGRIVMTGDSNSPHIFYMSDSANPFSWAYGSDMATGAAAVAGGFAGTIGDIATAAIPYRDDFMIMGCSHSMWLLRGDPAFGGSIDQLSLTAGVFDKHAFAFDSQDNLYFLDTNGIYAIPAGFGPVQKISQDTLPDFAGDFALDQDVHRVSMAYDRKRHGILICKTDVDTGVNDNLWLDLRTQGFFPEKYPADCGVYSSHYYSGDQVSRRELLLGSRDGAVRTFDTALFKDQTAAGYAAIESELVIGPGRMADEHFQAMLAELHFVLAEDTSDGIQYELYASDTAEGAVIEARQGQPLVSGTIGGGRTRAIRPRKRGAYLVLKLINDQPDKTWILEKITGIIRPVGRLR